MVKWSVMTASERARIRLKFILDRDAWTQREFAGKMDKSQPWLQKILSGENDIRLEHLDEFARVLGIPAGELIRDPENELMEVTPLEISIVRALRELAPHIQSGTASLILAAASAA